MRFWSKAHTIIMLAYMVLGVAYLTYLALQPPSCPPIMCVKAPCPSRESELGCRPELVVIALFGLGALYILVTLGAWTRAKIEKARK